MSDGKDIKPKIESLNKVFQFYYKENYKVLRKATDFYLPFFIGRKKRIAEFEKQYIPFSVALFLEGVRNSTSKMEGVPDENLISALRKKLLNKIFDADFEQYWNVIESELERSPTNPKAVSDALSSLLLFKLYGPEASEHRPDLIESQRHIIATEFQVGKIHYQYSRGARIALERIKNPEFDPINVPAASHAPEHSGVKPGAPVQSIQAKVKQNTSETSN